jgi:hypothetical protein
MGAKGVEAGAIRMNLFLINLQTRECLGAIANTAFLIPG